MGREEKGGRGPAHWNEEIRKVCTSFWKSRLVGGKVWRDDWAKGPPTGQISSHIHLLRLSQKWIATGGVVGVRMAVVAATHGVGEVAAKAHQSPVLLNEVEFDRCDCKSALDPRFALVVVGLSAGGKDEHSNDNDHNGQSMHLALHKILPVATNTLRLAEQRGS